MRPERVGFASHLTRPELEGQHPVHITAHRVAQGPSFRAAAVLEAIEGEIANAQRRGVHIRFYAIKEDRIDLLIEGTDRGDLGKQLRTFFARTAMNVNRITARHGTLFRDRYHRRDLTTPKDVREARDFFA